MKILALILVSLGTAIGAQNSESWFQEFHGYEITNASTLLRGVQSTIECMFACLDDKGGEGCLVLSYEAHEKICKLSETGTTELQNASKSVFVLDDRTVPYYYIYSAFSFQETNDDLWIANATESIEECYKYCILLFGTNCRLFVYGEKRCLIPQQDARSIMSLKNHYVSNDLLNLYIVSTRPDSRQQMPLETYSTLQDIRMKDGRVDMSEDIPYHNVTDLNTCYTLCVDMTGDCQMFSYDNITKSCYLTSANFHDDWTFLEKTIGWVTYFTKNSEKWKLMSKHLQHNNESFPDDAFMETGNYVRRATEEDTSLNGSYSSNSYLKNQLIDYWSDLTSKYKVRLEMRSTSGSLLQYIEFNAVQTNSSDWFSAENFLESSYSDLSSSDQSLTWTMRWEWEESRTFYISQIHVRCSTDAGWLNIKRDVQSACDWDKTTNPPLFLYSPPTTATTWAATKADFDVLLIYLSFH